MPHATIFVNHNKSSCPTLLCCWTRLLLVFVAGYATQHHFAHFATQHDTATKTWTTTWSTELDRRHLCCLQATTPCFCRSSPCRHCEVPQNLSWLRTGGTGEQLCVCPHTTRWRNMSAGAALFTDQLPVSPDTKLRGIWGVGHNYWRLRVSLVEIYMFGIMCGKYIKLLY